MTNSKTHSKQPILSVLSVTYNQENYIKQTIEGILAQKTNFDFEIIIADDGSKDKTPEIIQSYADAHPGLIKPILRTKNIGTIANVSDVLLKATGTYIAICEGDDYWTDPDKLQTQVDFLNENQQYVGCFHRVVVKYEGGGHKDFIFPEVDDKNWYTTEELMRTNYIPTNSVVYRRQDYNLLAQDVMPFDWYLHLYHAQFGPIAFIDKTMSVYRKHESGIWWDYDVDRDRIWQKYGVQYFSLLIELLRLYEKKPKYRIIIEDSMDTMLDTLIDVDIGTKSKLLSATLEKYPNQAETALVKRHNRIIELEDQSKNLTENLLKTGDELNEARVKVDLLKQDLGVVIKEVDAIKSSRTWIWKQKLDAVRIKIHRA